MNQEEGYSVQLVQFSHSVVSDSLRLHELQHASPPGPSPTPRIHPNSCPLSQWCHPAISYSVVPFSSCTQSLPASESFPMSQLFVWDGQSIRVSALSSVLPKNTQDWSPLEWTCWIFLQSKCVSSIPSLLRDFITNGCWILSTAFPVSIEIGHMIFILQFVHTVFSHWLICRY